MTPSATTGAVAAVQRLRDPLPETRSAFRPSALIGFELTEEDEADFTAIIDTSLTPEQEERILAPEAVYQQQRSTLAVHWHPEFIPIPLVRERMGRMFPAAEEELCIPTQHNELLALDGFSGVEVDCWSEEFSQKIQLLAHFKTAKTARAVIFRAMLKHTADYRRTQLDCLLEALDGAMQGKSGLLARQAAALCGADAPCAAFAAAVARKLRILIERYRGKTDKNSLKNKLVRNFLNRLRGRYDPVFIGRVQAYVNAVKAVVKAAFPAGYYYAVQEMIEEIRGLGGCIVIPHPEQFWPVLLAGYDVDGYEVWNPQSQRYTDFLISAAAEQNRNRPKNRRELLIFMGDDCHMSEKILPPTDRDPLKAEREVGLQPAWDDLNIRKKLAAEHAGRACVIRRYTERLSS
jgi:hypothetical protein